ncbi:MAG: type II toxin-antitoxin system VapC family toxin [Acidobacteria bacterium]|nr:type II toxin-antitoxin system VapC family toxin [Acidobacteriota bacterium]
MSDRVLDSSAVLAALQGEPGAETAETYFIGGLISAVNAAEVMSKLAEWDRLSDLDFEYFTELGLIVVDFTLEHARKAAELRAVTRHAGLSLGDRSCLALAIISNATAVTADKSWNELDVCPVELIR